MATQIETSEKAQFSLSKAEIIQGAVMYLQSVGLDAAMPTGGEAGDEIALRVGDDVDGVWIGSSEAGVDDEVCLLSSNDVTIPS